jgi:aminoglycoside 6-adenylyltransferase
MDELYRELEERFAAWAESRPDVRLALVVGSRARPEPDPWGDLDGVIFTTTPKAYADGGWIGDLGEAWAAYRGLIRRGVVEWMVVYADGLDFDLAIFPCGEPLTIQQVAGQLNNVMQRDLRAMVDRDGVRPETAPREAPVLPDAEMFSNHVQRFWRYAERAAKKLRRGELWMALDLVDGELKRGLLAMIEWHALAGGTADTWYEGHHLEEWADPRVIEALGGAFAHYDRRDAWRALRETMVVFGWLAQETADRLGLPYSAKTEAYIRAWVARLHGGL